MANQNWKIYIINLERAVVRKNFMLRQLKKYNIDNYVFINALDGLKEGEDWLQKQVDRENLVRPLTNTEIACVISHKMALEQFLQDKHEYAVVLEDDVLLPAEFTTIVENAISKMQENEVVLLSASLHTKQQFKVVNSLTQNVKLIKAIQPIEQVYFAAAYIMPRHVAKKHINNISPVTDVADSWNYYKRKGAMNDILLAFPYPVKQEVFQSTRGNKAAIYKLINWIIFNKVPGLYQFFSERRGRQELQRMNNVEIVS
jgi:GR25 family glycosyltransferase involved in LPS biosynthesis